MNVVVCGKVKPASTVTIEIDANTKRLARKGVPHELDPAVDRQVHQGLNADYCVIQIDAAESEPVVAAKLAAPMLACA